MTESGARPLDEQTQRHLSEGELAGFIDRDLTPDELRRAEIHLEQCAPCRAELVESGRVVDDFARRAPARARRTRRWWVPVAIAAGLGALLLIPRRTMAPPSSQDPTRAAPVVDGEGTLRIGIVAPADNATVTPGTVVLTWRRATADQYRVAVLTETGEPVWSRETTDTTLTLPANTLRSGQAYFWRVDAIANGITATTGVHRLSIGP